MRNHECFDKYARDRKMQPVKRVEGKFGSILLADSGEMIVENGHMFFRTAYAILRDGAGLDIGASAEYELNEVGGSQSEQNYRLDEAEMAATMFMALLDDVGYYDAESKHDFSPRPGN